MVILCYNLRVLKSCHLGHVSYYPYPKLLILFSDGVRNHGTLGLTNSDSWANIKRGPRTQRHLKYLVYTFGIRGNPRKIRMFAQREFQKIRLSEKPTLQGNTCPSRLGLLEEESHKEKTSSPRKGSRFSSTIKASIPSQIKVRIIYPLQHSRVENNSNLTVGGYLVDTTPVPTARSLFLLAGCQRERAWIVLLTGDITTSSSSMILA